jgi:hypothetical protein
MIWVAEGIMVPLAEMPVAELDAPEELDEPPELLELVATVVPGATTLIEKAGRVLVVVPSLAEMTMLS